MASSSSSSGSGRSVPVRGECSEYVVRLAKNCAEKTHHIMRFKHPHKCDLEQLVDPTLERQQVVRAEQEELPETGEGSEFGRKKREEARRRRRGYRKRAPDPDDQPWILKEKRKGGKHFVGRKEGTVNSSSSYYLFKIKDGVFEAEPVKSWYDFVPPVKYNFLDADEAEEKFEQRNKTLNYFSIMLSKKLKTPEDREEGGVAGLGDRKEITMKEKAKASGAGDGGLLLTDSDSAGFSSESDSEGSEDAGRERSNAGAASKKAKAKGKGKKKNQEEMEGEEAGEDTDEGDMESREVDYMSDASSNSELDFLAKEANKALPKDDAVLARKEQEEIDKGFVESSSSEDELTEKGKELKELMKKLSGNKDSSAEEEGEEMEEGTVEQGNMERENTEKTEESSPKKKSSKHSKKREREAGHTARTSPSLPSTSATPEGTPPAKKQKVEVSSSCITEEEVRRYLMRRPIASKDLVRKFTSRKTEMDKNKVVEVLHKIIEGLKNVETQTLKGKLYLSLKSSGNSH